MKCPHCGNETWEYDWDERAQRYTVRERPIVYGTSRMNTKVRLWTCCKGPA